jgi:hypothetical protein
MYSLRAEVEMVNVHYALQTCDIANNIVNDRFAGNRTEISKKCVKSFLKSVEYASKQKSDVDHHICIFDDHSSEELVKYLKTLVLQFTRKNITIEVKSLETKGIMPSIRACYEWLDNNGKDIVYQVQDDYLFTETAVFEMLDVWFQLWNECQTESIISPYNMWHLWAGSYRNRPTPRAVICGKNRYWIQYYDMSCSFMTSHNQFKKHWDLYETFFSIPPNKGIDGHLESISLNYMLTQRGVLGLTPVNSLALHLQGEQEKDPYIDWKEWWDKV